MDSRSGFYIENWFVCPHEFVIYNGEKQVHLEPQVMAVLLYLYENRNQVVEREQLAKSVWQGRHASDEVITRTISVLRKSLGLNKANSKLIQTIPKHGYIMNLDETLVKEVVQGAKCPIKEQNRQQAKTRRKYQFAALLSLSLVMMLLVVWWIGTAPRAEQLLLKVDKLQMVDRSESTATLAKLVTTETRFELSKLEQLTLLNDINSDKALGAGYLLTGSVATQEQLTIMNKSWFL
jgi:DNA-binding winged helix-turn-helix (wHTH) protein